jgi:hypothetical protein
MTSIERYNGPGGGVKSLLAAAAGIARRSAFFANWLSLNLMRAERFARRAEVP